MLFCTRAPSRIIRVATALPNSTFQYQTAMALVRDSHLLTPHSEQHRHRHTSILRSPVSNHHEARAAPAPRYIHSDWHIPICITPCRHASHVQGIEIMPKSRLAHGQRHWHSAYWHSLLCIVRPLHRTLIVQPWPEVCFTMYTRVGIFNPIFNPKVRGQIAPRSTSLYTQHLSVGFYSDRNESKFHPRAEGERSHSLVDYTPLSTAVLSAI